MLRTPPPLLGEGAGGWGPSSAAALAGLVVLERAEGVAGPYAGKLLAGLGATVVKLEPPGTGEAARRQGPFAQDSLGPERSLLFQHLNTGKRSATLRLDCPTGQRLCDRLLGRADALIFDGAAAEVERLGLSPDELAVRHPRLVVTSVTPFGLDGPRRDWAATNLTAWALGGPLYISGEPDREPLQHGGGAQALYQSGLAAFVATLAALHVRDQQGAGQLAEVTWLETLATITQYSLLDYVYKGEIDGRLGNRGTLHPWGLYPCQDGWVGVLTPGSRWHEFAELMEQPALADPKFATNYGRTQNADELDALMLPWLLEHTAEEIYHAAQRRRLPFAYPRTTADLYASVQLRARAYFVPVDHPELGRYEAPGAPAILSATPWQTRRAPLLGEHNSLVYGEWLGLSNADQVRLRAGDVI